MPERATSKSADIAAEQQGVQVQTNRPALQAILDAQDLQPASKIIVPLGWEKEYFAKKVE
jgi:hypothetical protein